MPLVVEPAMGDDRCEGSREDVWHSYGIAINLGVLGTGSLLLAHIGLAAPAYPFISQDWSTELSVFTHHAWIGGFFIVGASTHAGIFLVLDYRHGSLRGVERVLSHRHSILAHLNWICIFLGFHSFGLFIHNDTLSALGREDDLFSDEGLPFRPVIGMLGQSSLAASEGLTNSSGTSMSMRLVGTADLLVHHVHAFTVHVTALILVEGVLFARSSRLVPDKALGFRFPCDGPGRGGTCQVSSWDHTYLGLFWMYNCISVVIFH